MRAVAILASRLGYVMHWVVQREQAGELEAFNRAELRGRALFLGVMRPFIIVLEGQEERLRGLGLIGFVEFGPAVSGDLRALAVAQVRK